jgi:hypothetical protein
MDEPSSPAGPFADSDKLAAAVERAAEAALRRAPASLDLGDLASNAAFHVLTAWRLPKKRRSNALKQDFFQEILFDALLQPEEASRGIVGYLLTRRGDGSARTNQKAVPDAKSRRFERSLTWTLGVLAAIAGAAALPLLAKRAGLSPTTEGAASAAGVAMLAVFLGRLAWRGWRESALASRIENASLALAGKRSASSLIRAEANSAADGCGYMLGCGLMTLLSILAGLAAFIVYSKIGSESAGTFWGYATFFGLMVAAWHDSASGMAEDERKRLEKTLEGLRGGRFTDGPPPKAAS